MKNLSESIEESLYESGKPLEYFVLDYLKTLIKGTHFENKVFLAGGAVRDELMGRGIKDIDLLIDVPNGGIEFANWVCKKLGIYRENSNPVIYPKFGTAKFVLHKIKYQGKDLSGIDLECVMPRKETYTPGSRKPSVENGTLIDDVERRDFTVNSLLKNLSNDEILDLTGMGKSDIKAGVVKTPLNPDVIFQEDPLRCLRAIRFAVKYNWQLPLFMIRSIKKNAHLLPSISAERITSELNKMLVTDAPDKAIRLLQITGLSQYIFPELDVLKGIAQGKYHAWDAARHTNMVLKNTPPKLVTRLGALFHDIGKGTTKTIVDGNIHFFRHEEVGEEIARDIMTRLKYPNDIIDAVCVAVRQHMRTKSAGDLAVISDKALRKLALDLGPYLEDTLDVIHADNISHAADHNMPNQVPLLRDRLSKLQMEISSNPNLPINGNDIMSILNIKGGRTIGVLLGIVRDAWLENPKVSRDEAIRLIKAAYKEAE